MIKAAKRVFSFYVDGFRNLSPTARTLWLIIIVKLVIMFAILKVFFFPNVLERDYDTDAERAASVRQHLSHTERVDLHAEQPNIDAKELETK